MKKIAHHKMDLRLFNLFLTGIFITSLSIVSCIGGDIGGGGDVGGNPGSVQNAGSPENPPATVSLDPNCKKGAKPEGECKGTPLPVSINPCPSNLIVIKNSELNVWWCGCPESTQEMKDSEGKSKCVCPSGEGLWVNTEKGESLGCPRPEGIAEPQAGKNLCPKGLIQLEERKVFPIVEAGAIPKKSNKSGLENGQVNFKFEASCGCPSGTLLWKGTGVLEGQQGCQCPSGQLLPVDENTSKATKTCEELSAPCRPGLVLLMPVTPGHANFCGCPAGTEFVYPEGGGAALGCKCPTGVRVQVDPNTSEMIGSCAIDL